MYFAWLAGAQGRFDFFFSNFLLYGINYHLGIMLSVFFVFFTVSQLLISPVIRNGLSL